MLKSNISIDWVKFEEYAKNKFRPNTARCMIGYAMRYSDVLTSGNAQKLLVLSGQRRNHPMRALANLAKFTGQYQRWKAIRQAYDIKWDLRQQKKFDFEGIGLSEMLKWVRNTLEKAPKYSNIVTYITLTGLRPSEACDSATLIMSDSNYLNKKRMVLEHYKYPDLFLRRSKNAYISIVNDEIIELARNSGNFNYISIRDGLKDRGMETHLSYGRKIFATWLRDYGIPSEVVDVLQGRSPRSVFARHYFRPDFNRYAKKIRMLLARLRRQIG